MTQKEIEKLTSLLERINQGENPEQLKELKKELKRLSDKAFNIGFKDFVKQLKQLSLTKPCLLIKQ